MSNKTLLKLLAVFVGLLFVAAACGETSESPAATDAGEDNSTIPVDDEDVDDTSAGGGGDDATDDATAGGATGSADASDFCRATSGITDFADITSFDGSMFANLDAMFARALDAAPSELRDDVRVTRDAFNQFATILEKYDFNFFDAELQDELAGIASAEVDQASERVRDYLNNVCGFDSGSTVGDPGATSATPPDRATVGDLAELGDNPQALQGLMAVFGIDEELAACLIEELGDFDTASPDIAVLSQEVCGTTLLEIMSNLRSGG